VQSGDAKEKRIEPCVRILELKRGGDPRKNERQSGPPWLKGGKTILVGKGFFKVWKAKGGKR